MVGMQKKIDFTEDCKMGRALASWSGMRKYLEQEMLAEELHGRIRYGCTKYKGEDGYCVFELYIDGNQVKRFSWETMNTYFIENGYKQNSNPFGQMEYWDEFMRLRNEVPMQNRTEYGDDEFSDALRIYRNQTIQESIRSENPIVRMFAVLDRRIGKRTLKSCMENLEAQPEWLQSIYRLRFKA